MRPWGRIANPVVGYFDDKSLAQYFRTIRSCLPEERTKIIIVDQKDLWSFTLKPYFQRIYNKPGYPQHYPNTVNAEHTSASHAKYELMQMSVQKNYFKTPKTY